MIINFYICCDVIIKLHTKFTIIIIKIKFSIMSIDILVKYFIEFVDIDIINDIFCIKILIIFLTVVTKMNHIFYFSFIN